MATAVLKLIMYSFASGAAALVNFSSRFLYDIFFSFWLSVIFAYFTGMLVNYLLSRKYVFSSYTGARIGNTFIKFAFIALIGLFVTSVTAIFILGLLSEHTNMSEDMAKTIAHTLAIGAAFFASFFGHNFITFRSTGLSRIIRRKIK